MCFIECRIFVVRILNKNKAAYFLAAFDLDQPSRKTFAISARKLKGKNET